MNLDFNELEKNLESVSEIDFDKIEQSCFVDLSEEMPHPEIRPGSDSPTSCGQ